MSTPAERRLRRAAHQQGLQVHKFRDRNPQSHQFGRYLVSDDNLLVSDQYGFSLEELDEFLNERREQALL